MMTGDEFAAAIDRLCGPRRRRRFAAAIGVAYSTIKRQIARGAAPVEPPYAAIVTLLECLTAAGCAWPAQFQAQGLGTALQEGGIEPSHDGHVLTPPRPGRLCKEATSRGEGRGRGGPRPLGRRASRPGGSAHQAGGAAPASSLCRRESWA